MMNRCYTTTNKDYPLIGGMGIVVCEKWHNYDNFKSDMGEKPENTQLARYCESFGFTEDNTYWKTKIDSRTNRLYSIWKGIRRRCGVTRSKPSSKAVSYKHRNISIDPDWEYDFIQFANDVGQPPSEIHTIDRIDNNKGYFIDNVRWATPKEQANNRSNNIVIEMEGERKTLQEWCDYFDIDRQTVSGRWRNMFKPVNAKNQACAQYEIDGTLVRKFSGVREASAHTGIKQGTISKCLSGGNASAGGYLWRYEK